MGNAIFASKLKKARILAGFTQKDIYERLGISQSTFSSWETGKSEPDAETLIELCRYYSIKTLSYFDETINLEDQNCGKTSDIFFNNQIHTHIEKYRQLNYEGQRRVDEYTDDLVQSGKYKKTHHPAKDDEKTIVAGQ